MAAYQSPDFMQLDDFHYSDEERMVRDSVRDWVTREFLPRLTDPLDQSSLDSHVNILMLNPKLEPTRTNILANLNKPPFDILKLTLRYQPLLRKHLQVDELGQGQFIPVPALQGLEALLVGIEHQV